MPIESDTSVFEDRREEGDWRVEYYDDDGGCYVDVFAGPGAQRPQLTRNAAACPRPGEL